MSSIDNIRNFAIIAHIDHGKSTIADRIIHSCGGLTEREMKAQVLDSMDIERERGITIKAQTVKLNYKAKNGKNYILNIIDTPGHVDFSYEVSRSLYACEGSILIVDSTQGVEAQTLANVYQALDTNHEIVPVLNKVDLPASDLDRTKKQIEDVIGIDTENAIPCSGKTGEGIEDILEQIITTLPAPKGESSSLASYPCSSSSIFEGFSRIRVKSSLLTLYSIKPNLASSLSPKENSGSPVSGSIDFESTYNILDSLK